MNTGISDQLEAPKNSELDTNTSKMILLDASQQGIYRQSKTDTTNSDLHSQKRFD